MAVRKKNSMPFRRAQRDEQFDEPMDVGVALQQAPVEPTDIVVLAIGIVVAVLLADFVATDIGVPTTSNSSAKSSNRALTSSIARCRAYPFSAAVPVRLFSELRLLLLLVVAHDH